MGSQSGAWPTDSRPEYTLAITPRFAPGNCFRKREIKMDLLPIRHSLLGLKAPIVQRRAGCIDEHTSSPSIYHADIDRATCSIDPEPKLDETLTRIAPRKQRIVRLRSDQGTQSAGGAHVAVLPIALLGCLYFVCETHWQIVDLHWTWRE